MKTIALVSGMGLGLLVGCYAGVDNVSNEPGERGGKSCFPSYGAESEGSFETDSSSTGHAAAESLELSLTFEAGDPETGEHHPTDIIRYRAGLAASHFLAEACREAGEYDTACKETCAEQKLDWDAEVELCETCDPVEKGFEGCEPTKTLTAALEESWSGEQPWEFADEELYLKMAVYPPKQVENEKGEVMLTSEVKVTGLCSCACRS